ncbi:hypothetical protein KY312_02955 [Candidatus Woesearchaeota archaeon]|nr:hypothetical protein [Candidatus Woesearchaeota archaeon]
MKKILCLLLLICVASVLAHQPRITSDDITIIENPEISQAFYAELEGGPHTYEINSDENFSLYVGILVPAIEGIEKDVSAQITLDSRPYHYLNASQSEWLEFYEEFAGDLYYSGPELGANEPLEAPKGISAAAGQYLITVSSPDNLGKYVLVVGEKEEFPLSEMLNSVISLPKIKRFFNKSPFTAYFNRIGLFLLVPLLFVLILIGVVVYLKKR